jgi:hypothetical protein
VEGRAEEALTQPQRSRRASGDAAIKELEREVARMTKPR